MMEQNNTSKPKAHAANSRPEIELSLMTRIVAVVDKYSKPCQEEGEHVVDYDDMEEDLESLIAQEADKLANKRVREVLERLKAMSEVQRQDTPSYGIVYDEQIDEELEELDKGDSQ